MHFTSVWNRGESTTARLPCRRLSVRPSTKLGYDVDRLCEKSAASVVLFAHSRSATPRLCSDNDSDWCRSSRQGVVRVSLGECASARSRYNVARSNVRAGMVKTFQIRRYRDGTGHYYNLLLRVHRIPSRNRPTQHRC